MYVIEEINHRYYCIDIGRCSSEYSVSADIQRGDTIVVSWDSAAPLPKNTFG